MPPGRAGLSGSAGSGAAGWDSGAPSQLCGGSRVAAGWLRWQLCGAWLRAPQGSV